MTTTTHQVPPAFAAIFRDLVVAFQPRGLDAQAATVYWAALGQTFAIETLREAVQTLTSAGRRFFPTVAEWAAAAQQALTTAILEDRADGAWAPCEWCDDRGLVRIGYQSGEPFDVGICSCRAASFYRQAGPEFVRRVFVLTPEQRVAALEDFDDEDEAPPVPDAVDHAFTDRVNLPTRGVFVYAFRAGAFLKIGFSTNLARRYKSLCAVRHQDGTFIGRAAVRSRQDALLLERWLQHRCGQARLDGEWFEATPKMVEALTKLLRDPEAVARALDRARQARATLQATTKAQENAGVVGAVAMDVVKAINDATVPAESLVDQLVARCGELRIACDASVAVRALRAAAWRLQHR